MGSDPVDISTPLSRAIEIPGADQVGDDALGRTLGDVQQAGHISDAYAGITRNEEERISMVRKQPEVRDGAQGVVGLSLVDVLKLAL